MKKTSVLITAILPILLVGCGGGGDSSDNKQNSAQDGLENGTHYYFVDYDTEYNNHNDKFKMSYLEVWNKKFNINSESSPLGEFVLTQNRLYQPREIASNTVNLNSMTSWTSTYIGDIKTNVQLAKVNLAGKNIFDTVLPGYRTLGFDPNSDSIEGRKLLGAYGKQTFPQGSTCYRFVSKKPNQDYFNFSDQESFNQSFVDFDWDNQNFVDYLNKISNAYGVTYRYASGVWQNIPWTTIYETDTGIAHDDTVAVKYQNKTYLAEFTSAIEWTSAKEIKQWQNLLGKKISTDNDRYFKLKIEKLKNGCDVYNETAANTLVSLNMINW